MKRLNGGALVGATPVLALLAATGIWMTSSERDTGRSQEKTQDPSALSIDVKKGAGEKKARYRFTEGDIGPIVAAMSDQGITDFVCWINPSTGALNIVLGTDARPHMDISPGKCPNNIHVNGCHGGDGGDDGDDGDDDDGDDGDGGGHGHGHHVAAAAAVRIHVGLLGNAFDVTGVDVGSVKLSRADTLVGSGEIAPLDAAFLDVATPFEGAPCQCNISGPDGILDLSVHFDEQEMIDTFGLQSFPNHTQVPLKMTGMIIGGQAIFAGRDCIRIIQ